MAEPFLLPPDTVTAKTAEINTTDNTATVVQLLPLRLQFGVFHNRGAENREMFD